MSDTPFEAPSIESIGELLPAFKFELLIAVGGMGAVYKARQISLDRDVAIKVLPHEMSSDPEFRDSFQAEAKAMARLTHPNLIGIYDTGDVGGLLYIVMELVPGKSLYHSCYGKVIDPKQAAEIVIGICRGLAHAHESDIIHRDIKPANILLTPKAEPKIGDFGLAGAPGPDSKGQVMGTPGYTAPEILTHPDETEITSDIFSVGVLLRELLTGAPPESDLPVTPISDPALARICDKASNPNPAMRYQDALEMEKALETWITGKSTQGLTLSSTPGARFATPAAGSSATPYTPRAPQTAAVSSTNWPLMRNLLIIAFLLVAIYLAWGVYQRKQEMLAQKPTPPPENKEDTGNVNPVGPGDGSVAVAPPQADPKPAKETFFDHESAMRSLADLQSRLQSGDRSEMPEGSIEEGDHYFLYVDSPKSWNDAHQFALAHGAHLPIISGLDDIEWLSTHFGKLISRDQEPPEFWIGARAFNERWHLVDGAIWPLEETPVGSGAYGAIHENGILVTRKVRTRRPFVLQWHRDGSNPAALEEMLKACANTQGSGNPTYPFGAVERDNGHRSLIIWRQTNFDEALALAKLGGGRLMEAIQPEDADWIERRLRKNGAKAGFWLGATRQQDDWRWESGEPWTFSRWNNGFPNGPGSRMIYVPGAGWRNLDSSSQAAGLIIEWTSSEGKLATGSEPFPAPPAPDAPPTPGPIKPPPIVAELTTQAEGILGRLDKARRKALKKNADAYDFSLGAWIKRGRNSAEIAERESQSGCLKVDGASNRVPEDIPEGLEAALPEDMVELARDYLGKQRDLDSQFRQQAANTHKFYLKKLKDAANLAESEGKPNEARAVSKLVDQAADLDVWLGSFKGLDHEQPRFPDFLILSATFGNEVETADVTTRVRELILEVGKPFVVSPDNLQADPAPGYFKTLTIGFIAKGDLGSRSWNYMENLNPPTLLEKLGIEPEPGDEDDPEVQ